MTTFLDQHTQNVALFLTCAMSEKIGISSVCVYLYLFLSVILA